MFIFEPVTKSAPSFLGLRSTNNGSSWCDKHPHSLSVCDRPPWNLYTKASLACQRFPITVSSLWNLFSSRMGLLFDVPVTMVIPSTNSIVAILSPPGAITRATNRAFGGRNNFSCLCQNDLIRAAGHPKESRSGNLARNQPRGGHNA